MSEILLINPRKRRKSGKRRSAAQRAATAKMLAANRRRRGGRSATKTASRKRRRNPAPLSAVMHNPRRRRRSSARRRNPISVRGLLRGSTSGVAGMVKNAAIGAVGATLVNTAISRLPIPATLMTGRVRYLTQGVAAIGLAMVARKVGVIGSGTAAKMAEGSLTVTLHDAIRDVAGGMGVNLGGMGYYLPGRGVQAVPSAAGRPAPQLGVYVNGPGSGMGSMSRPAAVNRQRGF